MPVILDNGHVDVADRAQFARECLGAAFAPIELHWIDDPTAARTHGVVTDLGDLSLCSGRTTAFRVERTSAQARDDTEPCIYVGVQTSGASTVQQGRRHAVLVPGALVIYDSTAPFTLSDENGVTGHFFRIPHTALAMPHNVIRQACATSLSPGDPLTRLTHDYLCRIASDSALFDSPSAERVAHPSIELIRAVIATHQHADLIAAESLASTLAVRILEYARRHLRHPDLTAERIAAAHFISVRQLYKVLAAEGIRLADWIRAHRLEACRVELARSPHTSSIARVASSNGFTNMSSFSRTFREAYGLSPRDWRARHGDRAVSLRLAPGPSAFDGTVRTPTPALPRRTGAAGNLVEAAHPLHDTIAWMRQHARTPLDQPAIAQYAAVSPRTLNRQFRLHLGTTPLAVLAEIRVDLARQLLESTNHTVDHVARQCGFGSYSSLRLHFTRIVGVPPHDYRRGRTAAPQTSAPRDEPTRPGCVPPSSKS